MSDAGSGGHGDDLDPGLIDDARTLLLELAGEVGALSVELTTTPEARGGVPARTLPLGAGDYLRLELGTRTPASGDLEAALDRAVRALRTLRRRWASTVLPTLAVGRREHGGDHRTAVRRRIGTFLEALAALGGVSCAVVVHRGELVAASPPASELVTSRCEFIVRRVAAQPAAGSSHGELRSDDFFAASFWYGATLILLLDGPIAEDFVRHRARMVMRELAMLLPDLEPTPDAPAALAPRPT
jgi:hypothetical protein